MADRDFDIVIVGAGAAGLSAALAFSRDGYRTALVGGLDSRRDGRTVALLNGSVRLFEALGIWPAIAVRAAPLETMRIVDDTGSLFRPPPATFHASEIGLDAFGWNIENADLVDLLADAARRQEGLTLHEGQAGGIEIEGGHAVVRLEGREAIRAKLCVAADGRNSQLRKSVGIEARS
ncbi:MAG: UbiH/UbiF family hydroxylase, partial [Microvirga sp.]|nr:UbiH/UbiF family hydroxylase [Microvirga sp.]